MTLPPGTNFSAPRQGGPMLELSALEILGLDRASDTSRRRAKCRKRKFQARR